MASLFPGSVDIFKTIPTPTSTPTLQSDASNDTLSTRLQQHSDAIVSVETWLLSQAFELPGIIKMYGSASAPSGYLLCDGSAVSRTTFSALFSVIATSFGAGNGTTTFNVPDMRGKSPLGTGTGTGLTARAMGAIGGQELHVLIDAELSSHSHTIADPTHTHTISDPGHLHGVSDPGHLHGISDPGHAHTYVNAINGAGSTLVAGTGFGFAANNTGTSVTSIAIGANFTGISIAASGTGVTAVARATGITGTGITGTDTGHNTMHPFLVVNFIIKT